MKAYLDQSWPSIDVLERLVNKSSGQFIYASTVVKYVSSLRHQPADRLNVVLGIQPPRHAREMPFGELDALYMHILSAVEERDSEMVLLILGFHILGDYPLLNPRNLESFFLLNIGDIEMLFGDLSSIITISDNYPYFHMLHASFGDFLLDAARSKEFYIDPPGIHTTCMHLCFQHIKQCMSTYFPSKEVAAYLYLIASIANIHGRHITYAVHNLTWHCKNTPPSASSQLCEEIANFSLYPPDSCFAAREPGMSLFVDVPKFLQFIKTLVCPTYFLACSSILNAWSSPLVVLTKFTSKILDWFSNS
jgi:hypothetical protein